MVTAAKQDTVRQAVTKHKESCRMRVVMVITSLIIAQLHYTMTEAKAKTEYFHSSGSQGIGSGAGGKESVSEERVEGLYYSFPSVAFR